MAYLFLYLVHLSHGSLINIVHCRDTDIITKIVIATVIISVPSVRRFEVPSGCCCCPSAIV